MATTLISHQQAATAAAKSLAEEQRDRADHNLKLAAQAVDATANRISADPRLRAGDFLNLRVELLTPLIPLFEELSRQTGDNPAVLFQRGMSFGWLANLRREMGQTAQAERDFREYITTFEQSSDRDPANTVVRRRLAQGHNDLGNVLEDLSRWPEARAELETTVRLERELVATDPAARQSLAAGLNGLAIAVQATDGPAAAEPLFREALALSRTLLTETPDDRSLITVCAGIENNLAILLKPTRPAEAEALYHALIDRRAKLAAENPTDRENRRQLVIGHFNLGNLLRATGRFPAAEAEYRKMIGLAEKLSADYASVPDYRADCLGRGLISLGPLPLLSNSGRRDEAVEVDRRAADLFAKFDADFPANAGYRRRRRRQLVQPRPAVSGLDALRRCRGRLPQSGRRIRPFGRYGAKDPKRAANVAETWVALGDLARSSGKLPAAVEWYDKAIAKLDVPARRQDCGSNGRDS